MSQAVTALVVDASGYIGPANAAAAAADRLAAANDRAVDSANELADATADGVRAQEEQRRAVADLEKSLRRLMNSADPVRREMKKLEAAERDFALGVERGIVAKEDAARTLDLMRERLERLSSPMRRMAVEAEAAGQDAAGGIRLASHEITNLGYQLQDAAVQLLGGQNPLLILAQQGPQAAGAVGGVGRLLSLMVTPTAMAAAGIVSVAGAIALVAARYSDISAEARQYNAELKALNPTIDSSAEKLRAMSFAIANDRGVNRSDATAALRALVTNPAIQSSAMASGLAGLSQDIAAIKKQDVATVAANLGDAFGKGAAGVLALHEQLRFLTPVQAESIRRMEQQGRRADALAVATKALEERFGGSAKAMKSGFETAMSDIGRAWDGFAEKVANSNFVERKAQEWSAGLKWLAGLLDGPAIAPTNPVSELQKQIDELDRQLARRPERTSGVDAAAESLVIRRMNLAAQLASLQPPPKPPEPTGETAEQGRLRRAREENDRYAESLKGVGLARKVAAAGAAAYYAEIAAGGQAQDAEAQRLEAQRRFWLEYDAQLRDTTLEMGLQAAAAMRSAEVAGQGEAAMRAAAAANDIAAAASRSAAEASIARANAADMERASVLSIRNELIRAAESDAAANLRMAEAYKIGGTAVQAVAREEYRLAAQRRLGIDAVEELGDVMRSYDALQTAIEARRETEAAKQMRRWSMELDVLERRNDLLRAQAGATGRGRISASSELREFETRINIDESVQRFQDSLKDSNGLLSEAALLEVGRYRALLTQNGELEKQIDTSGLAYDAAANLGTALSDLASGDIVSFANGIDYFTDQFFALEDATGSTSGAFEELGKNLLESAEAGNALGNILGSIMGRSAEQKKSAQKGGAIGGTVGSFFGMKGAGAFAGNIIGGMFGMSKADERAIKLATEVVEFSKVANEFVRAGAPLSQFGGELAALDLKFASLKAEAIRLKQPVDALTASYEKQRAKLIASFGSDIQDVIDRLSGNDLAIQFRALQKAQDQRIQDALRAEYDLGQVRVASALELSDLFSRFTADQLAAMGSLVGRLDMVKARIRDLTGTLSTQIDSQIDMAQELANASRQQASSLRALASSLRDSIFSNLTGDLSPLSPFDRFKTLDAEFSRLFALAQVGDQDAGNRLDDIGGQLLEAAKQLYASAPEYVAIFNRVQAALAQIALGSDVRATGFDRLADAADVQIEILGDIRDVLSSDLAANLGNAITAALADGTLTVGEVAGIDSILDDLATRFEGIGGAQAQAVRTALEGLSPLLMAGALTPEQKAALTTGQGQVAAALNSFRSTQLEEYRQALIASGTAISALQNFILDPNGRIPAAIEAAFNGASFDQTLTGRIENLFRNALGDTVIPLPLSGRVYDLFGRAVGDAATIGDNLATRAGIVLGRSVGDATTIGENLATRTSIVLGQAIGDPAAVGDSLTTRADTTFAAAIGTWSQQDLASRITGQFGQAIGTWGETPLVDRINEIFARALGAGDGQSWQGTLKSVLDAQSPIVQGLTQLSAHVQGLTAAMAAEASSQAGQQAYDRAMQSFVSPVVQAASAAQSTLSTIPFDDRSGSHNNRTNLNVDATSGATTWAGGNKENESSRNRAAQLASGLSGIARQLEVLSGGDLSSFQVQAAEQNSGYSIGGINRLNTFGGNDFEAITRAFVTDAIANLGGGNAAALEILRNTDFTNLVAGMTKAASDIYKAMNPMAAVVSAAPSAANSNAPGRYNESAYLAGNPDVAAAVAAGQFANGLQHWLAYGQAEAAAGLRLPGFADGGVVTGGIPGRDSVPIMAMPGERVLTNDQDAKLDRIYAAVAGQATEANVFPAEGLSLLRELKAGIAALSRHFGDYRREQQQRDDDAARRQAQMVDQLRSAGGQAGGFRP